MKAMRDEEKIDREKGDSARKILGSIARAVVRFLASFYKRRNICAKHESSAVDNSIIAVIIASVK